MFLLLLLLVCAASYLGYAPRTVASLVARALRWPEWVTGKRPFTYDRIDDNIVVGRLPSSIENYRVVVQVSTGMGC